MLHRNLISHRDDLLEWFRLPCNDIAGFIQVQLGYRWIVATMWEGQLKMRAYIDMWPLLLCLELQVVSGETRRVIKLPVMIINYLKSNSFFL